MSWPQDTDCSQRRGLTGLTLQAVCLSGGGGGARLALTALAGAFRGLVSLTILKRKYCTLPPASVLLLPQSFPLSLSVGKVFVRFHFKHIMKLKCDVICSWLSWFFGWRWKSLARFKDMTVYSSLLSAVDRCLCGCSPLYHLYKIWYNMVYRSMCFLGGNSVLVAMSLSRF